MKIMLLEDEYMLLTSIKSFLLYRLHSVDAFESGRDALDAFYANEDLYEMFILDINTPELDGLAVLKKIREKKPDIPVIMITAKVDINSIDSAYKLGCSEYLKKPFNLRELELRMQRLASCKKISAGIVKISDSYAFDTENDNLLYNGMAVKLTKKQAKLVKLLVKNSGRILNYDKIKDFVWGDEYIEDSTVRSLVNRLRAVLKEDFIESYRGVGYKISL